MKPKGGYRSGSGAKKKNKEPTVLVRVPLSKLEEVKRWNVENKIDYHN